MTRGFDYMDLDRGVTLKGWLSELEKPRDKPRARMGADPVITVADDDINGSASQVLRPALEPQGGHVRALFHLAELGEYPPVGHWRQGCHAANPPIRRPQPQGTVAAARYAAYENPLTVRQPSFQAGVYDSRAVVDKAHKGIVAGREGGAHAGYALTVGIDLVAVIRQVETEYLVSLLHEVNGWQKPGTITQHAVPGPGKSQQQGGVRGRVLGRG